jgi:hypothetical protein
VLITSSAFSFIYSQLSAVIPATTPALLSALAFHKIEELGILRFYDFVE